MSLSSGGWAHTPTPDPSASLPGHVPAGASQSQLGCHTVLMSVRVSVCHSGIRPLCLPGAGDESLRLQLSMDPGKSGEFRLALRDSSGTARSVTIAEFDLRSVNYEVKSPKCHELSLATPPHERSRATPPHELSRATPPHELSMATPPHELSRATPHHELSMATPPHELSLATPPHDRISFNFRCEQEAQEWATVVMSSLREAHRVAANSPSADEDAQLPLEPLEPQEPQASSTLPRTEEMCTELTRAIEAGDMQGASVLAASLAGHHAALNIQPAVRSYEDTEINLAVVVEDSSSCCCVTVKVFPHTTTAALKQQVFLEYGFHPRVQRWVIGQCLCSDQRSLASYGVRRHGDTAFLYLLSARHARLTRQLLQQDQESALLLSSPPPSLPALPLPPPSINGPSSQGWRPYSTMPPRLSTSSNGAGVSGGSERGNISAIRDLINLEMPQLNQALSLRPASQGWPCPSCTYINKPTRPGCEICSTDRPDGYSVPGSYRPDSLELRRIQQEKEAVRQYQLEKGRREELRSAGAQNHSLLLNLDLDY